MTNGSTKTVEDLDEEMHLLQSKLAAVERQKLTLLETEGTIRTDMQRVENQLHRLKQLQKTPE